MGFDSIPPLDDQQRFDRPEEAHFQGDLATAHLTEGDSPQKESVSAEAEEKSFVKALGADRNDLIVREAIMAVGVLVSISTALWLGYGAPSDPPKSALAETTVAASAIAPAEESGPPLPPTIEGRLGKADVVAAVTKKEGQLKRCFEMGFERDAKLTGNLTMKLLVGETGEVIGVADVGSTVGDRGVVRCVARSMRTLSLPPTAGGRALVTYPLVLPSRR